MTARDEVERLVGLITTDCDNLAEEVTAFYEVFAEEVPLPCPATVIGATVEVARVDIAGHGEALTARCRRDDVVQDLSFSDLVFAPDTAAGWIHAAYRRCLGLVPCSAAVPAGWGPSWL